MTPAKTPSFPKRRAQAEHNRTRILEVARAGFAEDTEISMAEIARRAGVGMATLYRNFSGRRELLEALYLDEIDAVCEAAASPKGTTPGKRFETWLHQFFAFINSKHHVAELLTSTDRDAAPLMHAGRDRVITTARPLLIEAQRSTEIRNDLTLEQILQMVTAIAAIDHNPDYVEPILRAALDGLHASR